MRFLTYFTVFLYYLNTVNGQFDQFMDADEETLTNGDTVREKWAIAESRIKSLSQEAVNMIYPIVTEVMGSLNISRSCFRDSGKLFLGLRKLRTWALKFIDATTKSADGILGLKAPSLGSYDECVDNKVFFERRGKPTEKLLFQGKYCNLHLKPYLEKDKTASVFKSNRDISQNVSDVQSVLYEMRKLAMYSYSAALKAGLCLPSGCSTEDANTILRLASEYLGMKIKATRCATKSEDTYTSVMIAVMCVYSFTGVLVLLGTFIDIYCYYFKKDFERRSIQALKAFSIVSNFKKLISSSSSETNCLNGMRFVSLSWVILGHTYMYMTFIHHSFSKDFLNGRQDLAFQAVANAFFGVDTFFFISGFLVCYTTMKLCKIQKRPFSVTMYIVHRLWRILPAYAFVIGFEFLKPLTGSGPLFDEIVLSDVQACKDNWWTNFLFINNFYNPEKICVPQSWFIAVDTQLHIFALVVLLPLMRWPKVGVSIAGIIIAGSMIASGLMSYLRNILPIFTLSEGPQVLNEFHHYVNMNPLIHAPGYFIGLLLGYLIVMRTDFKVPKIWQVLGWSASISVGFTIVYVIQKWNGDIRPTVWDIVTYSAFCRATWCLCIAWMTFCCCTERGGVINYILSWKMWAPLSRLSYIAYLLHVTVILAYNGNVRDIIYLQHYTIVWIFIGNIAVTYASAFVGSMMVEGPFLSLEKVIFMNSIKKEDHYPGKEPAIDNIDLEKNPWTKNNLYTNGFEKNVQILSVETINKEA